MLWFWGIHKILPKNIPWISMFCIDHLCYLLDIPKKIPEHRWLKIPEVAPWGRFFFVAYFWGKKNNDLKIPKKNGAFQKNKELHKIHKGIFGILFFFVVFYPKIPEEKQKRKTQ